MSETAEVESFDAEFDAAREAEAQDETGLDTEASGEEGGSEEAAAEPTDADKAARQIVDTNKALKESRRATRELKERLAAAEERLERAERERTPPEPKRQAVEGMPDPNVDPIGALEYLSKRIQADEAAKAQTAQTTQAQQAEQKRIQAVAQRMNDFEADFKEDHPDYDAAAELLKTSRIEELKEAGFGGADLNRALAQDMFVIVQRAMAAGKDPAEVVYNLAKKRGHGVDKGATKLQTIAKGQQASRSLGTGGRPSGHLPVDQGTKLKGAAFDKWFEQEARRQKQAG